MEIFYTYKAVGELEKLPRAIQKRIVDKMRFYARQENPLKFAEHLTDYRDGDYRFRIGDYRLTFDIRANTIYILKIAKRDKAYD